MKKILTNKEILSNIEILKKLQKDNQKGKNTKQIVALLNHNRQLSQETNQITNKN